MVANIFRVTQTGVSTTAGYASVFFPNIYVSPFQCRVGVVVNSTGAVYTVEHSYDYPGPNSSTWTSTAANWFASTGITAATTNAQYTYDFPVTAIRIQSSAGSSIGTMAMTIVQAG